METGLSELDKQMAELGILEKEIIGMVDREGDLRV